MIKKVIWNKKLYTLFLAVFSFIAVSYILAVIGDRQGRVSYKYYGAYKELASIDKVYIINMDSHTKRYQDVLKELSHLQLPAENIRFSAING